MTLMTLQHIYSNANGSTGPPCKLLALVIPYLLPTRLSSGRANAFIYPTFLISFELRTIPPGAHFPPPNSFGHMLVSRIYCVFFRHVLTCLTLSSFATMHAPGLFPSVVSAFTPLNGQDLLILPHPSAAVPHSSCSPAYLALFPDALCSSCSTVVYIVPMLCTVFRPLITSLRRSQY